AVLMEQAPVGLLLRNNFMNTYAHRYGPDLYGKKPVYLFAEKNFLAIEMTTPLELLSKRLTAAIDIYVDEFVLLDQGLFAGRGTLLDLLKGVTEQQLQVARHANPLTLLPGNVPIAQALNSLLANVCEFVAAYCDLDNFKPFNDYYGHAHGDEVILLLSEVLKQHVVEGDFVGHIGGDDFMLFLRGADWQQTCERILADFGQQVVSKYRLEDQLRGHIEALDRNNQLRRYPIISLSIGALQVVASDYPLSPERITDAVSKAKVSAKRACGNTLAIQSLVAS
ncbi:MAG: GGDEF domain-containing protein, partial [Porticoccaceae bacterium]